MVSISSFHLKVSIASVASVRRQPHETMTPRAHDEPPSGFMGDPSPFLLEWISELADVLWLVWPSPDTFPEDVPQMLNWRQVWGLRRPWGSFDSTKLQVILDNTCTIGSSIVVMEGERIPVPAGVGHNNSHNRMSLTWYQGNHQLDSTHTRVTSFRMAICHTFLILLLLLVVFLLLLIVILQSAEVAKAALGASKLPRKVKKVSSTLQYLQQLHMKTNSKHDK